MTALTIRPISAAQTRPLRQRVLRPHQPPEALVYPGDEDGETLHVGGYLDGEGPIAVASVYREDREESPGGRGWRLRGMAVLPESQGAGYGAALLHACMAHAKLHGGEELWCNARTTAAGFYRRLGFTAAGPEFELPGIGPHFLMWRPLA